MQVVGAKCEMCGTQISSAGEASECPNCQIAFHIGCLADSEKCPQCGRYYAIALRVRAELEARKLNEEIAGGRRMIVTTGQVLVGLQLVVILAGLHSYGFWVAALDLFKLILLVVALVTLYLAVRSVRIWLAASLGVSLLVSLLSVIVGIYRGQTPLIVISTALLVIFGVLFAYLTLSHRVTQYIELAQGPSAIQT